MNSIDWKRKLSSRKFWAMIVGFAVGLIIYFGCDSVGARATEGLIMSMASVVVYICAEAAVDSAHVGGSDNEERK